MKKMKKIFAMLLAFTMVLGMSMTTLAANTGDVEIPIKNAGASATFAKSTQM